MDESTDLNNNAAEEKIYSLRPRSTIKNNRELDPDDELWKPRGRTKKRSKQKSAPLSKYRRKTANARERSRMREINEAFEALRRAVPHLNSNSENPGEKISKIMTLRLAMKYITALSNALQEPNIGDISLSDIIIAYEGSGGLTPGSISEQSELCDDFFTSTLPSDSLSPTYDSPGLVTPPLSEPMQLPSFNNLRDVPSSSSSAFLHSLSSVFEKSSLKNHHPHNQPYPLTSQCDLRTHTLTPPEEVSLRSFSGYHFKEHPLPPSYSSTAYIPPDFDGLPSPAMDFEDLFIK